MERYRTLFEAATDVLMGLSVDGRVTFASPSAEILFGRTPDELVGARLSRLPQDNDAPLFGQWVDNVSTRVGPAPNFRVVASGGVLRSVECAIGAPRASADLGVAHERNNPLTYVMGNLDLVKRRLKRLASEGVEVADMLPAAREALDGAQRVRRIVRDLNAFAGADDGLLRPLDLRGVVSSACKLAGSQLRSRARVREELLYPMWPRFEPTRDGWSWSSST